MFAAIRSAAMAISDTKRWLRLKTPLGKDQMILTGFSGEEAINGFFSFRLDVISLKENIQPTDLLGKEITFSVSSGDAWRHYHGVVSRLSSSGAIDHWGDGLIYYVYHIELVPEYWFLTHRVDCRIYQQKTTKAIIEDVLSKAGAKAATKLPTGRTWEYCVQYLESDWAFIQRLIEEEGWVWFLRHQDGANELHVGEDAGVYFGIEMATVEMDAEGTATNVINAFDLEYRFLPTKWANEDYDFKAPSKDLLVSTNSVKKTGKTGQFEIYDFPGNYIDKGNADGKGDRIAKRRIEALEANFKLAEGHGAVRFFEAGGYFTLNGARFKAEDGKQWVVARVRHAASGAGHAAGEGGASSYGNSFVIAPKETILRPARTTPRPIIAGPQTALVVGPSGEEIDVDEFGRIHVQFHWDRLGEKNEKSSCWIRVAQSWAGPQWGTVFTPRIGMEVVVEFLNGDPDLPLVTGCVYNGANMPPWELPANKTQSGIETRSTKNGAKADTNIFRFEDKKSSEVIYMHAQKDHVVEVEHDENITIDHDQTRHIKNNQTLKVDNNQAETIIQNRDTKITKGNDTYELSMGNLKETISMGNRDTKISMGNDKLAIALGKQDVEAMQSIELKVGSSSVKLDQTGVTIKGIMVKIDGTALVDVKSVMTQIKGTAMLILKGGITLIN
ncbi:MAG: type VI secretion system tip protein VgrG [Alphaproteobacteria bacterium]|nr:type VI secretion system tip protein VgrG [Alphaproteobacteria bacterium]